MKEKVLVTGGLGFIGSNLCKKMLGDGHSITIIDNMDSFYDINIKNSRMKELADAGAEIIIKDIQRITRDELKGSFDYIIHLAALAGVRPSIANPVSYYATNVTGTLNLLEIARDLGIKRFIFASSSSVYGNNVNTPWKESESDLKPISPYASTKLAGEDMGRVYSSLYDIKFTALRFFTVYGPGQRPDLAINKFIKLIKSDQPIDIYGNGTNSRDYTYIDDIVNGIILSMNDKSNYEIYNIGSNNPINLNDLIDRIGEILRVSPRINYLPMQPGDVDHTYADIAKAFNNIGYKPEIMIEEGLRLYIESLQERTKNENIDGSQ